LNERNRLTARPKINKDTMKRYRAALADTAELGFQDCKVRPLCPSS
jgi:hypothetical protein